MWIFDEGPVEEEAVLVFTLFVLWYQPYLLVMERISNYSHFRPVFDYFRAIRIGLLGIRYITLQLVK